MQMYNLAFDEMSPQVSVPTTPSLNLSVMREFRFQGSHIPVVTAASGGARQLPPRPVRPTEEAYLTPLARSLRTGGAAALSSNNNLNRSSGAAVSGARVKAGERRLNISVTEDRSSPRSQSRQRGVLLPLLQEKDLAIQELERKVASLEEERARDEELKEKLLKENENLVLENLALEKNVKGLDDQVEESEGKRFQLEMRNMEMIKVLELEQEQVGSLQAEVARLSQEGREDTDLDSLVKSFVEKVSILCRNENLKVNYRSRNENVKLKLVTRKTSLDSLENTHLCEESQNIKCNSISPEISSKLEEEETKEVETDKDEKEEKRSPVQVKAQKRAEKPEKELRSDQQPLHSDGTTGPMKKAPANKKLDFLKVETRVRTRSMSKQGKDPKVKK